MTSSFTQWIISDDNITNPYNLTIADLTQHESSIDNDRFAVFSNDLCEPNCSKLSKSHDIDIGYIIKWIFSFIIIFFVIIICILVVFRHFQYSQKKQKKGEERLQTDKLYAHSFEEIAINIDESQSIHLLEVTPSPTATTTPTN